MSILAFISRIGFYTQVGLTRSRMLIFVLASITLTITTQAPWSSYREEFITIPIILFVLTWLTVISRYIIISLRDECYKAREDFGQKRQYTEVFYFLFLYQVVYLSGISVCCTLATRGDSISLSQINNSSHISNSSQISNTTFSDYFVSNILVSWMCASHSELDGVRVPVSFRKTVVQEFDRTGALLGP